MRKQEWKIRMSSRIAEQVPEHGARTPFVSAKKAATLSLLQVLYFVATRTLTLELLIEVSHQEKRSGVQ